MKTAASTAGLGLTSAERRILCALDTPERVQSFIVKRLGINHELNGETILSVRRVLSERHAHCIEGAMVAACALWLQGEPPLVMFLHAVQDWAHVVTLFRANGCWGAISKTNGPFLRYRDPVYRTLRELALSYFHEYANQRGLKTLRGYSGAIDMRRFDPKLWITNQNHCWEVHNALEASRHYPLITARQERRVRYQDAVERRAGKVLEYPPPAQGSRG